MDDLVSIVLPSRNEKYLQKTIRDLLLKAKGKIEIIAVLDGYWPPVEEIINDDPRVIYLHFSVSRGMRGAINAGVSIAKGEYLMKLDAHCMVGENYDEILKADCQDNWIVVPRRLRLEPETWTLRDVNKPPMDYMYLTPNIGEGNWGGPGLHGREWTEKNEDESLKSVLIDDLMSAQGSCYFMKRAYFHWLELLDDENYGTFAQEFQEVGLKCWLSGGRIIVNKKTWYAHWHKGKENGRGYHLNKSDLDKASNYVNKWITEKVWHKQIHDLKWLVNKFAPVPLWDRMIWTP